MACNSGITGKLPDHDDALRHRKLWEFQDKTEY